MRQPQRIAAGPDFSVLSVPEGDWQAFIQENFHALFARQESTPRSRRMDHLQNGERAESILSSRAIKLRKCEV